MGKHITEDSPLTEQQALFVKKAGEAKGSLTAAARLAGYSDPKGEVDRLLKSPAVFAALMKELQPKLVKLEKLIAMGYNALYFNLDPANWDKTYGEKDDKLVVSSADRTAAVRVLFDSIAKIDPKLLKQKARESDEANETDAALESILDGTPKGAA